MQKLFKIVAELGLRQRFDQILSRFPDRFVERHASDRHIVAVHFQRHTQVAEIAIAIDETGRGDFCEIVILSGNPKNGHRFEAALGHAFGQLYRGERFIDRVERSAKQAGLLARNYGHAVSIAQQTDVRQGLFTSLPTAIHLLQCAANRPAIRFVIGQNSLAAIGNFVMKTNCFGVEASQSNRIAQIIEKESSLLWNFVKRKSLNAQIGALRRTLTGGFGGGQFQGSSCRIILRVGGFECQ